MGAIERVEQWFKDHEDEEFLKDHRILSCQRLHPRPDICAMLYVHNFDPNDRDIVSCAEHDEIWFDFNAFDKLTEDDVIYLLRCGIRWDDDARMLASFV